MLIIDNYHTAIAHAVEEGFAKNPKHLPSWLFYDEAGDKIFQAIMRMPEYYLTGCEYEILNGHKENLRQHFTSDGSIFDLIEFGAGDGLKTEILLRHFSEQRTSFQYMPVDISSSVLDQLTERLLAAVPSLSIQPVNKPYDEALVSVQERDHNRKVYLFLGANIGNFIPADAEHFVATIAASMEQDDQLLIGFDLKKDPRLVQAAYDDPHGITRDFNLNLLVRLNRELGADFQPGQFTHYPYYDPETGITKSYLVSMNDQDVHIEALHKTIHFKRWEIIHTEVSQKYDVAMIEKLAARTGLEIVQYYYDRKYYFTDVLFRKKS